MNPKVRPLDSASPARPHALPLGQAMSGNVSLARLTALLRESNDRLAAIRPLLPDTLAAHVRAGPLDDSGWSLLAANAAVAAKLRQLQPRLESALRERGWQGSPIRVKIQTPHGNGV
jgi:hypothetical protein